MPYEMPPGSIAIEGGGFGGNVPTLSEQVFIPTNHHLNCGHEMARSLVVRPRVNLMNDRALGEVWSLIRCLCF